MRGLDSPQEGQEQAKGSCPLQTQSSQFLMMSSFSWLYLHTFGDGSRIEFCDGKDLSLDLGPTLSRMISPEILDYIKKRLFFSKYYIHRLGGRLITGGSPFNPIGMPSKKNHLVIYKPQVFFMTKLNLTNCIDVFFGSLLGPISSCVSFVLSPWKSQSWLIWCISSYCMFLCFYLTYIFHNWSRVMFYIS